MTNARFVGTLLRRFKREAGASTGWCLVATTTINPRAIAVKPIHSRLGMQHIHAETSEQKRRRHRQPLLAKGDKSPSKNLRQVPAKRTCRAKTHCQTTHPPSAQSVSITPSGAQHGFRSVHMTRRTRRQITKRRRLPTHTHENSFLCVHEPSLRTLGVEKSIQLTRRQTH